MNILGVASRSTAKRSSSRWIRPWNSVESARYKRGGWSCFIPLLFEMGNYSAVSRVPRVYAWKDRRRRGGWCGQLLENEKLEWPAATLFVIVVCGLAWGTARAYVRRGDDCLRAIVSLNCATAPVHLERSFEFSRCEEYFRDLYFSNMESNILYSLLVRIEKYLGVFDIHVGFSNTFHYCIGRYS